MNRKVIKKKTSRHGYILQIIRIKHLKAKMVGKKKVYVLRRPYKRKTSEDPLNYGITYEIGYKNYEPLKTVKTKREVENIWDKEISTIFF